MTIPQTVRRALFVVAIFVLFLLYARQSSTTRAPHPSIAEVIDRPQNSDSGASRSYPPPSKQQNNQQTVEDVTTRPLRKRLEYHFPYDMESKFPAYIWQTWKVAPSSQDFEERLRPFEASWTEKHAGFVHEVLTDEPAHHLVSYLYASVPEVVEAYESMPLPVLKADFFRYLILLARGGIYTDIDTVALKPTTQWLPKAFDRSTVGLIIGIEADPDRPDWARWYARRIQFCQWTIQSKPGHPVLVDIVATITEDTLKMKAAKELRMGELPTKSIMEFTGPGVWTDAIFSYLNNKDYFDFSSRSTNVTASDFFNIKEQKKIGDLIVLPITSFSPGVGQMGAGPTEDEMAFVKHEFDGSWKPEHERMKGP